MRSCSGPRNSIGGPLVVAVLLMAGVASAQDAATRLQWFEKTWEVRYLDGKLGLVRGRAVVTQQTDPKLLKTCPKIVKVTLTHPTTGRTYRLEATAIQWNLAKGDLRITLRGQSPFDARSNLPPELERGAITLPAAPGSKLRASLDFAEAVVPVAGAPTETIVLRFKVDDLFQLAEGTWSYAGSGTVPRDQRRHSAAIGGIEGEEIWTTVQPLTNYGTSIYLWCRALSSRLARLDQLKKKVADLEKEIVPASNQALRLQPMVEALDRHIPVIKAFDRDLAARLEERTKRFDLQKEVEDATFAHEQAAESVTGAQEDIFVVEKGNNIVVDPRHEKARTATLMLKQLDARLETREKELREAFKGLSKKEREKRLAESAVLEGLRRKRQQTEAILANDREFANAKRKEQAAEARLTRAKEALKDFDANRRAMTLEQMQARWTRDVLPADAALRNALLDKAAFPAAPRINAPAMIIDPKRFPALGPEIGENNEIPQSRALAAVLRESNRLDLVLTVRLRSLSRYVTTVFHQLARYYEYKLLVVRQVIAERLAATRAAEEVVAKLAEKNPDAYTPLLKELKGFNELMKKTQSFMDNTKKGVEAFEKTRTFLDYKFGKDFGEKAVDTMDRTTKVLKIMREGPSQAEAYFEVRDHLVHAHDNPVRALLALEKLLGSIETGTDYAASYAGGIAGAQAKLLMQYLKYVAWAAGHAAKKMDGLQDQLLTNELKVALLDRRKQPNMHLWSVNEVQEALYRQSTPEEKVNRLAVYLQLKRLRVLLHTSDPTLIRGTRR